MQGCAPARRPLMPASPITLVIARFEDLLARGLRVVIDGDATLEVLAGDVEPDRLDVVLRGHRPRVAILDVDALTKVARIRELGRQHPDTRLVLISSHPGTIEGAQLLAFGASACLSRHTQARDILTAIHLASRGLQLLPRHSGNTGALEPTGSQRLTRREADVLPMLQQGSSNAQIALALQVSVETVRTHARNIYRKLGVASRRELGAPSTPTMIEEAAGGPDRPPARRIASTRGRQRHSSSTRR